MSTLTFEISDPRLESDKLRLITVLSASLGGRADVTLIPGVPEAGPPQGLVILLHGVRGSHWSWTLQGGVHHTLRRMVRDGTIPPLTIAMPSDGLWGCGSGYVLHHGIDFARWVLSEVPSVVREVASIDEHLPLFLGGLSMGGYGALRLGASHADGVKAVSAHSAITQLADVATFCSPAPGLADVGEPFPDVAEAIKSARDRRLPALRFDCGIDDRLVDANRALHADLAAAGIDHVYEESPGGHDWTYWSEHVTSSLAWFAEHL